VKMPTISDAEWEVMNVVWSNASKPVTAGEIVEQLAPRHDWSPRTIKTMLNRLIKKGALGFKPEGTRYLYHAKVTREQCVREESRSFLQRIFGGEAGPMLNYFVQSVKLSPAEIEELRKLLNNKP
jgi:BlaI family transcriptional regulator, penicillinase repressor